MGSHPIYRVSKKLIQPKSLVPFLSCMHTLEASTYLIEFSEFVMVAFNFVIICMHVSDRRVSNYSISPFIFRSARSSFATGPTLVSSDVIQPVLSISLAGSILPLNSAV